jgi:hypothetical protein
MYPEFKRRMQGGGCKGDARGTVPGAFLRKMHEGCTRDGSRRISGCGGEGLVSKTDQMNRPSDL